MPPRKKTTTQIVMLKPKRLDWDDRIALGRDGQIFEPIGAFPIMALTKDGKAVVVLDDLKPGDRLYVYRSERSQTDAES